MTLFGATTSVIKKNSEFLITFSILFMILLTAFLTYHLSRLKCSSLLVFLQVEVSHDSAPFYCLLMPYHI